MFVFSLIGNGLVLFIIYRFEKLTTVTNILLLNLVFSSLIFMSSLPFWGIYMQLKDWIFGKFMCKLVGSVYYMGFYSSVLFLTLLTFDRHLAVVYSLGASQVRTRSPIFYTFVGKKFQNYFRQLLVKRFPELKKHISVS
ncbi:hypothetical protein Q5P01_003204 [Channa striata]|uniref:G-protein coupled receptors family 1 profile domain-containing protein n=1 Tax=Channa striata TaxID=64152 RepID=A0AA88T149_CHASR|nr:hypothetical protein Q5P01_003204 [Channa striata]